MLDILNLEGLLRNGSWSVWLIVFLLVLVFWLVRVVTDLRTEVKVAREEVSQTIQPNFLARFTELNNIRQLKRIRDAFRRAAIKGGSGRFDLEIQREINQLKQTSGGVAATAHGGEDQMGYDSEDDLPVGTIGNNGRQAQPPIDESDNLDFQQS